MPNDTRTPDDIERDIRSERAQMSDTMNDLQKKFSGDAILGDLGSMLRVQGGDMGRAISDTVGRNPAAVALVGVGLAWMFLGKGRDGADRSDAWRNGGDGGQQGRRGSFDPWDTRAGGQERQTDYSFNNDDHFWYGDGQKSGADRGQGSAHDAGIAGQVRHAAASVGDAVSDKAGQVGQAAADLTARLSHGLDMLSDEARARVVAARRAAHDAQQSSRRMAVKGSRAAVGFFEDQPLVVGALAVALGAALGGVLPHSRIEDDTIGNSSDALFARAQALFEEEREKATRTLGTAAKDARNEVRDIGHDLAGLVPEGTSVGELIVDRVAGAASRVVEHATGGEAAPRGPDTSAS